MTDQLTTDTFQFCLSVVNSFIDLERVVSVTVVGLRMHAVGSQQLGTYSNNERKKNPEKSICLILFVCCYVPRLTLAAQAALEALDLARNKYLISEAGRAGRLREMCVQIGQLASWLARQLPILYILYSLAQPCRKHLLKISKFLNIIIWLSSPLLSGHVPSY